VAVQLLAGLRHGPYTAAPLGEVWLFGISRRRGLDGEQSENEGPQDGHKGEAAQGRKKESCVRDAPTGPQGGCQEGAEKKGAGKEDGQSQKGCPEKVGEKEGQRQKIESAREKGFIDKESCAETGKEIAGRQETRRQDSGTEAEGSWEGLCEKGTQEKRGGAQGRGRERGQARGSGTRQACRDGAAQAGAAPQARKGGEELSAQRKRAVYERQAAWLLQEQVA